LLRRDTYTLNWTVSQNRFLPYKGKFNWVHSYEDGYSFLVCTWDNPEYIPTDVVELLIRKGEYKPNEMKFTISGYAKLSQKPFGRLLTTVFDEDNRSILGLVGIKISEDTYAFKNKKNESSIDKLKVDQPKTEEKYNYNVVGCEYSINFNKKPKVSQSKVDGASFERAEVENSMSYLRLESIVYQDLSLLKTIDKDYIFSVFESYANAENLNNPGYNYEENELGKFAQMIAFKTITKGQISQTTKYVVRAYYGNRSAVFVYAMCPTDRWPTPEVQEFLTSIKRI